MKTSTSPENLPARGTVTGHVPSGIGCRGKNGGFAVIVAIVLMAFVLMISIALSSLVRVELLATQNHETVTMARMNAMYGLSVALGELQKFAGPDQRSTGVASLYTASGANVRNGLVLPTDGSRYWTAVWGNASDPDDDTSSPVLLNWLVSGNEGVGLNFDSVSGRIGATQAANVNYAPDDNIALTASGATIRGGRAAILVGEGSVEDGADYIVAPIVDIANTGDRMEGGYAFWVGDEGVKSNVALTIGPEMLLAPEGTPYGEAGAKRVLANQSVGAGGQLISDGEGSLWGDYALSSLGYLDQLRRLTDLSSLDVMNDAYGDIRKNRWHEISVVSQGLQTDTLHGGLKTDLSLAFEMPDADFTNTALFDDSVDGHVFRHNGVYGPKWALLRDYYRLYKRVQDGATAPFIEADLVTPLPGEDPDLGIAYLFSEGKGDPMSTGMTASSTIEGGDVSFPAAQREAIFP